MVVTINYRLGALGFLNLHDATDGKHPASGVEGLTDQIAALRWVRDNIAAFGGDPDNVTLFGESAGAMSIGALLAMPSARGLFHKAILQSGAAHIGRRRESSAKVARLLLDKLGVSDAQHLAAVPLDAIMKAQAEILNQRRDGGLPFGPTIDGALLPVRAVENVRAGSASGVPVLSGTTMEEWKLFTAARPKLRLMNKAKLRQLTENLVGKDRAQSLLDVYSEGSNFERWNAIMTDRSFAVPSARLLEAQGAHAPVFFYRFDWRSPLLGGVLGSCHALEIGFVFGTYNEKRAGLFFGNGPKADALSATMMQSWIAFARNSDPSATLAGAWPRYETTTRRDKRSRKKGGGVGPNVTNGPRGGGGEAGNGRGWRLYPSKFSLRPNAGNLFDSGDFMDMAVIYSAPPPPPGVKHFLPGRRRKTEKNSVQNQTGCPHLRAMTPFFNSPASPCTDATACAAPRTAAGNPSRSTMSVTMCRDVDAVGRDHGDDIVEIGGAVAEHELDLQFLHDAHQRHDRVGLLADAGDDDAAAARRFHHRVHQQARHADAFEDDVGRLARDLLHLRRQRLRRIDGIGGAELRRHLRGALPPSR